MAVAPNHQKLIIPGKNYKGVNDPYGRDMRAIEQWANEGIVRKLIAGSNITLLPASGVDDGQGIEISASGGGGGTTVGYLDMLAGPGSGLSEVQSFYMGMGESFGAGGALSSLIPIFSNSTGHDVMVSFGTGWVVKASAGNFINVLPEFAAPSFTGGPINIMCEIAATNATFNPFAIFLSTNNPGIIFNSNDDIQFDTTDFTLEGHAGTDLTLVGPPSGQIACGIKTAAGGVFWCGISGYVTIPTGTTMT